MTSMGASTRSRERPTLPLTARLACWLAACVAGRVSPDEFADAVTGDDPRHLLVDADGDAHDLRTVPVRSVGDTLQRVALALPVPGDPLGLAGPVGFNHEALAAGGAVLLAGTGHGLVPTYDARTVLWRLLPAEAPAPLDPAEADRGLRSALSEATARLVDLDVASWRPELPDLLLDVRHRPGLPLPPGVHTRLRGTIERAVLCREIVGLALADDGGSVSAAEAFERREALTGLERAARYALAAACGA